MNETIELQLDEEFDRLLRPLNPMELHDLEQNILKDGAVLTPVVAWGSLIVDGKHRWLVAKKHSMPFEVKQMEFADREAVVVWMMKHQLGRRNADSMQMNLLRKRILDITGDVELAAAELQTSRRTMYRAVAVAGAVDKMPEDVKQKCIDGHLAADGESLRKYGALPDGARAEVNDRLRKGTKLDEAMRSEAKLPAISSEDLLFIRDCDALSWYIRRQLESGSIASTPASIAKLRAIDYSRRLLVNDIFETSDYDDLDEVMRVIDQGVPQKTTSPSEAKAVHEKIDGLFGKLLGCFSDLRAIYKDDSTNSYDDCIAATKHLVATWKLWRDRYA